MGTIVNLVQYLEFDSDERVFTRKLIYSITFSVHYLTGLLCSPYFADKSYRNSINCSFQLQGCELPSYKNVPNWTVHSDGPGIAAYLSQYWNLLYNSIIKLLQLFINKSTDMMRLPIQHYGLPVGTRSCFKQPKYHFLVVIYFLSVTS